MSNYNFYLDHIEVVFEGDVILDSRSCGMGRILDEFSYDISLVQKSTSKECLGKSFSSLANIIHYLTTISDPEQANVFRFLCNHFIASRRRNFGHFRVNVLTSNH